MDHAILLPVRIFFSICALIALFSVVKADKAVSMTAKWFKGMLKLYGMEGEIRPTPKAIIICRVWNIFMLLIFGALLFFIK